MPNSYQLLLNSESDRLPRIAIAITFGLSLFLAMNASTALAETITIRAAQITVAEQLEIPALESGTLVERFFREGEVIEEGQKIGQIDDQVARLAAAKARAELALAKALTESDLKLRFARKNAEVSKAELTRSLESVARYPKSVSQTELDQLALAAQKAELEVEQAEFDQRQLALQQEIRAQELAGAELMVARREIKSPLSGTVVNWKKQRGEWVDPGTPVVRVVRLNPLRIDTFLPSSQARLLHIGQTIQFLPVAGKKSPIDPLKETGNQPSPVKALEGKITFINPEVDPVGQQVRIWIELPNPELSLRPGDRGDVTLELTVTDAQVIPLKSTNTTKPATIPGLPPR